MTNASKVLVLSVSLMCALVASSFAATPAAAREVTFTLYGSRAGGWGYSNTTLTTPGPHLEVVEGDNVTLVLTSADTMAHDWFIDYDLDSSDGGDEPGHPGSFQATETSNFTADRNGTYVYRSAGSADGERMWGLITILPAGSSGPGLGPGSTNLLIVGAAIAIFLGVLAVAIVMGRRRRTPPPPPEEPREE